MVRIIAHNSRYAEELSDRICGAASQVKVVCGVVNNVAVAVMLDAFDKVKRHPNYRHTCKQLYKAAIAEMHAYENRLLHAERCRFFHVDDMPASTRKSYDSALTDRQYFELWQGMGSIAYQKVLPLITCLHNKFRVSMVHHHVQHPDIMAWPMTAMALLNIADKALTVMLEQIQADWQIERTILDDVFKGFSMRRVGIAWHRAIYATDALAYDLDSVEQSNIEVGILQLAEELANSDLILQSVVDVLPEYGEMFRTKGEMKKAQRQITEFKQESHDYKANKRKRAIPAEPRGQIGLST